MKSNQEMPTSSTPDSKRVKIGPTRTGGEFNRIEIGRQATTTAVGVVRIGFTEGEVGDGVRGGRTDNVAMANFSPLERRNGGRGEK